MQKKCHTIFEQDHSLEMNIGYIYLHKKKNENID